MYVYLGDGRFSLSTMQSQFIRTQGYIDYFNHPSFKRRNGHRASVLDSRNIYSSLFLLSTIQ